MAKATKASVRIEPTKMWAVSDIKPYPSNPRTHPPAQITLLAQLMKKFGPDQDIVVDEHGEILKGHGRLSAAIEAELKEYPVTQRFGLSTEDKIALRISDNQVALLSGWNNELVQFELKKLQHANYPIEVLGFDNVQLVTFLATPSQQDPEVTPDPPTNPTTRPGDIWLLGKHRILCGDSTKADDVERVLDGKKPHLMATDPPYGVEYDAAFRNGIKRANGSIVGARAIGKVANDDRCDWREAWSLFAGDVAYVWCASLHIHDVAESLIASGFDLRASIIWAKNHIAIGRGDYHWQHEPCWYVVRKGKAGRWAGDRKQTTLWEIDKPSASETGHSTQKPIECMRRPIQNNSKPGDYVYDPFLGSATTLISAEMMNRYCLGIEIDPTYVDVGVLRWQTFSKGEAILAGDGRTFAEIAKERSKKKPKAVGKRPVSPPRSRAQSRAASLG